MGHPMMSGIEAFAGSRFFVRFFPSEVCRIGLP